MKRINIKLKREVKAVPGDRNDLSVRRITTRFVCKQKVANGKHNR